MSETAQSSPVFPAERDSPAVVCRALPDLYALRPIDAPMTAEAAMQIWLPTSM